MSKEVKCLNTLPPLAVMVRWREEGKAPEEIFELATKWVRPQSAPKTARRRKILKPVGCADCAKEPFARGLCRLCYSRAHNRGALGSYPKAERLRSHKPPQPRQPLMAIGCDTCKTEPHARGLCVNCYVRAYRRGVVKDYPLGG